MDDLQFEHFLATYLNRLQCLNTRSAVYGTHSVIRNSRTHVASGTAHRRRGTLHDARTGTFSGRSCSTSLGHMAHRLEGLWMCR